MGATPRTPQLRVVDGSDPVKKAREGPCFGFVLALRVKGIDSVGDWTESLKTVTVTQLLLSYATHHTTGDKCWSEPTEPNPRGSSGRPSIGASRTLHGCTRERPTLGVIEHIFCTKACIDDEPRWRRIGT